MIFFFIFLSIAHGLPVQNNEEVEGSDAPMINAGFYGGDMAGFNTRNAVINRNFIWPGGVIPYVIDNSLRGSENLIKQAMDHYHQVTCLRFRPRTNEQDYVYITAENGCWSFVGRQFGRQKLSLGSGCLYRGTVIHELLHAVGLWHEQNRPDRDNWIIIYYNNIMSGQEHNFKKFSTHEVQLLGEQYDVTSIMQYGEYAFAKDNRSPTIKARSGAKILDVWQKNSLSASDKRRIKALYRC